MFESFIELKYFHSMVLPCQLSYAMKNQLVASKGLWGGFGCDELVLYGIRELA